MKIHSTLNTPELLLIVDSVKSVKSGKDFYCCLWGFLALKYYIKNYSTRLGKETPTLNNERPRCETVIATRKDRAQVLFVIVQYLSMYSIAQLIQWPRPKSLNDGGGGPFFVETQIATIIIIVLE